MESDAFALRTALFTIFGIVLLSVSWTLVKQTRGEYKPYLVVTDNSISGMAVQSRVYYKGVEVGTVEDIYFGDGNFDRVMILIDVEVSIPVAKNTYAQLALRGITGEYDLRLENTGPLGELLPTSEQSPAIIPMQEEFISRLGTAARKTMADISSASNSVSAFLSDENNQHMQRVLINIGDAAQRLSDLEERLIPTLDELPQLITGIEQTLAEYRALAAQLKVQSSGIEPAMSHFSAASASIEELVEQLRHRTLNSAESSLAAIDRTSEDLSLLLQDLRQDPQRLLLGSPDLELGPGETPRDSKP